MSTDTDTFGKCSEYFKDDNLFSKMKNPEQIKKQMQTIKEKAPYILAEFKKTFVLYNKNPEYSDYQQMFSNIKANVSNINIQLFNNLNEAELNTDELNKKILCLNSLIVQEKKKNRILKRRNGIVEEKNNAASEQIYDYTKIYEEGYLRNWGLVISIIIVGLLVKNMYGNISGEMNPSVANVANNVKNIGSNFYNKAKNIGK
jgi:hypothetical protein